MVSIEEQIRLAQEQGHFENLPGKGRPLQLDENPLEDPAWRLANHVLRTGGFTLPWIENLRAIESEIAAARVDLARSWAWRQTAQAEKRAAKSIEADWQQAVAEFRAKAASLNRRLWQHNLQAPAAQFQRLLLQADEEILKITNQPAT
jgi:DnaJ family protein C protein 28